MEELCVQEVEELHRFFEDWFNANVADDDAVYARFRKALSERFEMTSPDGDTLDRDTVLRVVRAEHGKRPGTRVWIENASARLLGDGMYDVTYEEWQSRDTVTRGRRSQALMRQSETAPMRVEWVRLTEAWIE